MVQPLLSVSQAWWRLRSTSSIVAVLALSLCSDVVAQQQREPGIVMIPIERGRLTIPATPNGITIQNFGDSDLALQMWQGKKWEPVYVAADSLLSVRCNSCEEVIQIRFHDGKTNQKARATKGSYCRVYRNEAQNKWVFDVPGHAMVYQQPKRGLLNPSPPGQI